MEEEANSWIRRTKFSHTVCHRLDAANLSLISLNIERDRVAGLKSRPGPSFVKTSSEPIVSPLQRNPSTNKHRAVSPEPITKVSKSFKEARSSLKRFSTPHPRRKENDKGIAGKIFDEESHESKSADLKSQGSKSSPLRHLASMKLGDKKSRKDSTWTKYFDHAGGRVISVETLDEYIADLSKLFLGLRFAHGADSNLYHGIYNDEAVAVKIIKLPEGDQVKAARLEKQYYSETSLLSRLHHENVIKFVAACSKRPVFCIITEYLSEGSLRSYLHKLEVEHEYLPLKKLITMALEISKGMEYIHSQGIIHRDLKPENILINGDLNLKIADFGIACEEAYCDLLADDPGTYRWMAPEMIKRKSYGRKVDVYGFGLILWEMVAGTIPYKELSQVQAAFAVVNKNIRPTIPADCHPAMRALIEQCWSLQPEKRPEFWQIVKVLEQFESSLSRDGTLNLVPNTLCQDHKKGLLNWIQKLGPVHTHESSVPKPKFA